MPRPAQQSGDDATTEGAELPCLADPTDTTGITYIDRLTDIDGLAEVVELAELVAPAQSAEPIELRPPLPLTYAWQLASPLTKPVHSAA